MRDTLTVGRHTPWYQTETRRRGATRCQIKAFFVFSTPNSQPPKKKKSPFFYYSTRSPSYLYSQGLFSTLYTSPSKPSLSELFENVTVPKFHLSLRLSDATATPTPTLKLNKFKKNKKFKHSRPLFPSPKSHSSSVRIYLVRCFVQWISEIRNPLR